MDSHGIIHSTTDSYFATTSRTVYKVSHRGLRIPYDVTIIKYIQSYFFPMTKAVKLQALNTFKPYAVFYRTGGQIEKFHFINGWGASVANHDGSYGGDEGLYELAEINPNGHIVDESIKGWLTFAEVDCYLREISEY